MSTSLPPEFVNMVPYIAKGILQMGRVFYIIQLGPMGLLGPYERSKRVRVREGDEERGPSGML